MKNVTFSRRKGFTLIELLIVIAIISMLASIIVTALAPIRQKANDAKRVADVKQLASALELYASDHNGTYPIMTTPGTLDALTTMYSDPNLQLVPKYIPKIPVPPTPPPPGYTDAQNSYTYVSNATGTTYNINVVLSAPVGNIPAGISHIDNTSNGGVVAGDGSNPSGCTRNTPTFSISYTINSRGAGGTAQYTLSTLDNDSAQCAGSTYYLKMTGLPAGWTTNIDSTPSITVTPGSTTTFQLLVTSSPSAPHPQTYPFTVLLQSSPSSGTVTSASSTFFVNNS